MAFSFKSSFSQWSLDSVQKKKTFSEVDDTQNPVVFLKSWKKKTKDSEIPFCIPFWWFFLLSNDEKHWKKSLQLPQLFVWKVPTQLDPKHRIPTEFFQHKKSAAFFETPELRLKSEWHQFGEAEACLKTPAVLSKGNFIKRIDVLFLIWKVKKHLQKPKIAAVCCVFPAPKLGFFPVFSQFFGVKIIRQLGAHTGSARESRGMHRAGGVNILARKILTFKDKIFHCIELHDFLWIWEILQSVNFMCIQCEFVPSRCSFISKSLF